MHKNLALGILQRFKIPKKETLIRKRPWAFIFLNILFLSFIVDFGLAIRSVFFSLSLTACQKRGEQLSSPNGQPVHEMAGPFSNMNGYCYFILGILILAAGYFTYGRVLEKIFRPDASRQTPAVACTDGVDYVVMPRWRVFLIQLLNIAGLGPIFGAVMGVLYGPAALLWIVIGCIFGGMVHDYFSGMISLRHKGENLPEILGRYLGSQAQWISRAVCIVFSVLVGVVFAVGPAAILAPMTGWSVSAWVWIIFGYYFLATILPIQAIMGKVYPLFSVALIIMVVGILGVMLLAPFAEFMPYWMHIPSMEVLPDLDFFHNRHPADFPLFPVMFITIACGAVSGFHATQSPLMARCISNEKHGRQIFYGAMIAEGVIGLIWVTLGMSFYTDTAALDAALGLSPTERPRRWPSR